MSSGLGGTISRAGESTKVLGVGLKLHRDWQKAQQDRSVPAVVGTAVGTEGLAGTESGDRVRQGIELERATTLPSFAESGVVAQLRPGAESRDVGVTKSALSQPIVFKGQPGNVQSAFRDCNPETVANITNGINKPGYKYRSNDIQSLRKAFFTTTEGSLFEAFNDAQNGIDAHIAHVTQYDSRNVIAWGSESNMTGNEKIESLTQLKQQNIEAFNGLIQLIQTPSDKTPEEQSLEDVKQLIRDGGSWSAQVGPALARVCNVPLDQLSATVLAGKLDKKDTQALMDLAIEANNDRLVGKLKDRGALPSLDVLYRVFEVVVSDLDDKSEAKDVTFNRPLMKAIFKGSNPPEQLFKAMGVGDGELKRFGQLITQELGRLARFPSDAYDTTDSELTGHLPFTDYLSALTEIGLFQELSKDGFLYNWLTPAHRDAGNENDIVRLLADTGDVAYWQELKLAVGGDGSDGYARLINQCIGMYGQPKNNPMMVMVKEDKTPLLTVILQDVVTSMVKSKSTKLLGGMLGGLLLSATKLGRLDVVKLVMPFFNRFSTLKPNEVQFLKDNFIGGTKQYLEANIGEDGTKWFAPFQGYFKEVFLHSIEDTSKNTIVHSAARAGNLPAIQLMWNTKLSSIPEEETVEKWVTGLRNVMGKNPLDFAYYFEKPAVVTWLCEKGVEMTETESGTKGAETIALQTRMQYATTKPLDPADISDLLIDSAGQPVTSDVNGGTLLHQLAHRKGTSQLEIARVIEGVITKQPPVGSVYLMAKDGEDVTATERMARGGHLESLKALHAALRAVGLAFPISDQSVIFAATNGHHEIVQFLLAVIKEGYPDKFDGVVKRLFSVASTQGVLDVLMATGFDLKVIDEGADLMLAAVEQGHLDVVYFWIEHGLADLDERSLVSDQTNLLTYRNAAKYIGDHLDDQIAAAKAEIENASADLSSLSSGDKRYFGIRKALLEYERDVAQYESQKRSGVYSQMMGLLADHKVYSIRFESALRTGNGADVQAVLDNADVTVLPRDIKVDDRVGLAMHFAAFQGKFDVVEVLLNDPALRLQAEALSSGNPKEKAKSVLHWAVLGAATVTGADAKTKLAAYVEVIKRLVMINPRVLEMRDEIGKTPMHLAVENRSSALVELLMILGASMDAPALSNDGVPNGETPWKGLVRETEYYESKEEEANVAIHYDLCEICDVVDAQEQAAYNRTTDLLSVIDDASDPMALLSLEYLDEGELTRGHLTHSYMKQSPALASILAKLAARGPLTESSMKTLESFMMATLLPEWTPGDAISETDRLRATELLLRRGPGGSRLLDAILRHGSAAFIATFVSSFGLAPYLGETVLVNSQKMSAVCRVIKGTQTDEEKVNAVIRLLATAKINLNGADDTIHAVQMLHEIQDPVHRKRLIKVLSNNNVDWATKRKGTAKTDITALESALLTEDLVTLQSVVKLFSAQSIGTPSVLRFMPEDPKRVPNWTAKTSVALRDLLMTAAKRYEENETPELLAIITYLESVTDRKVPVKGRVDPRQRAQTNIKNAAKAANDQLRAAADIRNKVMSDYSKKLAIIGRKPTLEYDRINEVKALVVAFESSFAALGDIDQMQMDTQVSYNRMVSDSMNAYGTPAEKAVASKGFTNGPVITDDAWKEPFLLQAAQVIESLETQQPGIF
ncbi:hypothetical protein HOH87_06785 [bacterium]|nr:hypothetical protein [bacterium]